MKKPRGKFWMYDNFVREHAKYLSVYSQSVYMALACHCDARGETFIGYRRIAESLGIDKNTVNKSVNELIAYGHVIRLDKKIGRASYLKLTSVLNENTQPSYHVGHKEVIKEVIKEEKNLLNKKLEQSEEIKDSTRKNLFLEQLRENVMNKTFKKKLII